MGSKRNRGQSYADDSELPLSSRVREMIEAMFEWDIPLLYQLSATSTIQRRNEVWAGTRAGTGGFIRIQCLHYMIHGTETEYIREMTIILDGFKLGTNNGTTELIEMSRNSYH